MIDKLALFVSHGLLMLAAWRLLRRDDLDHEAPPPPLTRPEGFGRRLWKARHRA